jgi:hypothetical protein
MFHIPVSGPHWARSAATLPPVDIERTCANDKEGWGDEKGIALNNNNTYKYQRRPEANWSAIYTPKARQVLDVKLARTLRFPRYVS